VFDSLFIANFSTPKGYAITLSEVTYFAYLACLLSVYRGEPAGHWGYVFAATKSMSPFSDALGEATETLANAGRLEKFAGGVRVTDRGVEDLNGYRGQHLFHARQEFLRAACNSSLAVPLPAVGEALSKEPDLKSALAICASRELLLDDAGPRALHRHFRGLVDAIPDKSDLFLAAVTWIGLLAANGDSDPDSVKPVKRQVPPSLEEAEAADAV
jgi:hypothetical protein